MSDRELLELAAKAEGRDLTGWIWKLGAFYLLEGKANLRERWQPLSNDGDALRLAADLRLKILPGKYKGDGCSVESQRVGIAGCTAFRDDPSEQMRVAIVTVAAEIGKNMP